MTDAAPSAHDADEAREVQDAPDTFELFVERAIAAIPAPFSEHLGSVAIVIEDEPTREQLAVAGAPGLLGLYQGIPRTSWGADAAPLSSKISIFRGPLERSYRDPAALERAVYDTLLHEVAHHLGISDGRLHELAPRFGHADG